MQNSNFYIKQSSYILICLFLYGCPLTDEEVDEIIDSYDGQEITRQGHSGPIRVGPTLAGSGIAIDYIIMEDECETYGWAQVIRERLDDRIVNDPTKLPDPDDEDGKREQWRERTTDEGYHVDGFVPDGDTSDGRGLYHPVLTGNGFTDDPHMLDEDIEANTLDEEARLYIMEAETCVRCLEPESDYLACVSWIYTKIKDGSERSYITGLKRSPRDSDFPSDSFKDAVDEWSSD